jgi:hypothetical protein
MRMGPHDLLVNIRVSFAAGTAAEQMREAICCIEADLRSAQPETTRVYIEAEFAAGRGDNHDEQTDYLNF